MKLNIIDDPRINIEGLVTTYASSETEYRGTSPLFSSDPFSIGRVLPELPELVKSESFVLKINREYFLEGHNVFLNKQGDFFIDSVLTNNVHLKKFFINTDREIKIKFSETNERFIYTGDINNPETRQCLDGEIGVALSREPSNWGSFLVRVIPKIISLKNEGINKFLIYCHHPLQREMLTLLGVSLDQVIPHNPKLRYEFSSDTIFQSEPTTNLYIHRTARHALRGVSERFMENKDDNIYLSRRRGAATNNSRTCVNEEEIEVALSNMGFKIVYPDLLTVEQQIKTFANASMVIGCSGAGLFNSVFCKPETVLIDIESQTNWISGHTSLFSSLGLKYGIVWGKPIDNKEGHVPFMVDVCSLKRIVSDLLA